MASFTFKGSVTKNICIRTKLSFEDCNPVRCSQAYYRIKMVASIELLGKGDESFFLNETFLKNPGTRSREIFFVIRPPIAIRLSHQ
jgi:hypothetical protein